MLAVRAIYGRTVKRRAHADSLSRNVIVEDSRNVAVRSADQDISTAVCGTRTRTTSARTSQATVPYLYE